MTQKENEAEDIVAVVCGAYEAYATKDRAAIERLIAPDFHFTSPVDNRTDRETYFARYWPNSAQIADFDFINLVSDNDRVFVTYEGRRSDGRCAKTRSSTYEVYLVRQHHTKLTPGGFLDK